MSEDARLLPAAVEAYLETQKAHSTVDSTCVRHGGWWQTPLPPGSVLSRLDAWDVLLVFWGNWLLAINPISMILPRLVLEPYYF